MTLNFWYNAHQLTKRVQGFSASWMPEIFVACLPHLWNKSLEDGRSPLQRRGEQRETKDEFASEHEADRQLAARILAGETRAFAQLYDSCAPSLLRRLTRMTGSVDQAEDCLQQVFVEAMRTMSQYRGQGRLEAWLERIATYVAMGWYRKKYRWRSFVEEVVERVSPTEEAPSMPDSLPEQMFLQEEMKTVVWQLLDRLGPRKRMLLVLCDLEGHTIEEAANHLDIPVGTAASRLYHARQDFQKAALAELRRQGLSVGDWLNE